MNITILCVGKLKEKYWRDAEAEYSKRLKRFVNLQITELKESLLPANASPADEAAVKEAEGEAILAKIKSSDHVISLEIDGKGLSSTQLSAKIEELGLQGKSSIVFVIGGSLGLSCLLYTSTARGSDLHIPVREPYRCPVRLQRNPH